MAWSEWRTATGEGREVYFIRYRYTISACTDLFGGTPTHSRSFREAEVLLTASPDHERTGATTATGGDREVVSPVAEYGTDETTHMRARDLTSPYQTCGSHSYDEG